MVAPARNSKTGILYVRDRIGHKAQYQNDLSEMFDLEPRCGSVDLRTFVSLLTVRRVLMPTIDDHYGLFMLVGTLRALMGRNTVGLCLRPQQCFRYDKVRYRIKYYLFRYLKEMPRINVLCITPQLNEPKLTKVSNGFVHDPQLWDLNTELACIDTGCVDWIKEKAGRRAIISYFGETNHRKGLDFLAQLVVCEPRILKEYLIVVAGPRKQEGSKDIDRIAADGGVVIDRRVSDAELLALYKISDLVWCCYRPLDDYSSGIFGRCLQLGRRPIVREGSSLQSYSRYCLGSFLSLNYEGEDRCAQGANRLLEKWVRDEQFEGISQEVRVQWRHDFNAVVNSML